jgi:hypothetical protein
LKSKRSFIRQTGFPFPSGAVGKTRMELAFYDNISYFIAGGVFSPDLR